MIHNKICCILMLKNENKYVHGFGEEKPKFTMLEQMFLHLRSFVDSVYIVDGGSDDGSLEVYDKNMDIIKFLTVREETIDTVDENLKLNIMLEEAIKNGEKWVLNLDGDEILEDDARKWLRYFVKSHDCEHPYTVRIKYINLWRSRSKYRYDKFYGMEAGKFFSLKDSLRSFGTEFNNHHFAFGKPEVFGTVIQTDFKLLHYAWVDWNHILRKTERNVLLESRLLKITEEEARDRLAFTLDERGIVLQNCLETWMNEYRDGKIKFEDLRNG